MCQTQILRRITNDRGGLIAAYTVRYQRLASSGESVIIDGLCASACTMVLSALPYDKICVTPRATLGFHAQGSIEAQKGTLNQRCTALVSSLVSQ
jgi:hypothetical protein